MATARQQRLFREVCHVGSGRDFASNSACVGEQGRLCGRSGGHRPPLYSSRPRLCGRCARARHDRRPDRLRRVRALSIWGKHPRRARRRGRQGHEGCRQGPYRARPVGWLHRPARQAVPGRCAVDQGALGARDRRHARDRRCAERPGIHQDHAGHLHQGWGLRHLFGRVEPSGRSGGNGRHSQARRLRGEVQARVGRARDRLCARRGRRVADEPVSRLDLWGFARWRLPDLGLSHRPVRRRRRAEGLQGQIRLRPRAAEDLEAARRHVDVLPPPGQEHAGLDRYPQPGLGLHQLVPALRDDGVAQPVPVRRRRHAAHQLDARASRPPRNMSTRLPTSPPTPCRGAGPSSTATSPRAAPP